MSDYERIEKSILYLEKHFPEQPTLKEVADYAGLSEYHFQKLFKRWAGISPKRFVQYLTAQNSGALIRKSSNLLDASMGSGLSSVSRLHDLIVNVYAMTPDEYRNHGESLHIEYGRHSTPFGTCLAAITKRGLCWLSFHDDIDGLDDLRDEWGAANLVENPENTRAVIERIFNCERQRPEEIMLQVKGTNLQIRVWEALLTIPPGQVNSYSDIAKIVDRPDAVRAVASAVGRNSVSYVIPCHRVIRRTGALGGYRWGLARKQAMLGWEFSRSELR